MDLRASYMPTPESPSSAIRSRLPRRRRFALSAKLGVDPSVFALQQIFQEFPDTTTSAFSVLLADRRLSRQSSAKVRPLRRTIPAPSSLIRRGLRRHSVAFASRAPWLAGTRCPPAHPDRRPSANPG